MRYFVLFLTVYFFGWSIGASAQNKIPTANISGKNHGFISVKELLNADSLSLTDTNAHVISFRCSIYKPGGDSLIFKISSQKFSSELKEAIPALPKGTKIYFEFIIGTLSDGTKPALSPLGFTLK